MNPAAQSDPHPYLTLGIALSFFFLFSVVLAFWIRLDTNRFFASQKKNQKRNHISLPLPTFDWNLLQDHAESIVKDIISTLPEDLKLEAEKVPCIYQTWSLHFRDSAALGLYSGIRKRSVRRGSGTIYLFMGDIFKWCKEDLIEFDKQVRITYLHEFGHHLGWTEEELEIRGLR